MRLAIDLDGTILTFNFSDWVLHGSEYFGKPKRKVNSTLAALINAGHDVVIHTARINERFGQVHEQVADVQEVLYKHQVPYTEIWCERGKPVADVYIDDKAMKFKDWDTVLEELDIE